MVFPSRINGNMSKERKQAVKMLSEVFVADVLSKVRSQIKSNMGVPKKTLFDVKLLNLMDQPYLKEEEKQPKPEPVTPKVIDMRQALVTLEGKNKSPETSEIRNEKGVLMEVDKLPVTPELGDEMKKPMRLAEDLYEPKPDPEGRKIIETTTFTSKVEEENKVPPLKLVLAYKRLRSQPFTAHPYSLGFNLPHTRYALEAKRNRLKAEKKKELPPLSSFIREKKNFYNNFTSPVPPGFKLMRPELPPPDLSQDEEISSSTKDKGEPIEEQQLTKEDLISSVNSLYFKSTCPDHLTKVKECSVDGCFHELPESSYLEDILQGNTIDIESTYKLVKKFKPELRKGYFPMLARLFAKKGMSQQLKTMLADISKMNPFIGFHMINDALLLNGWTPQDSVQFIIDNHEETAVNQQNVRMDIVALIGSLKEDVLKFVTYLKMVSDDLKATEM